VAHFRGRESKMSISQDIKYVAAAFLMTIVMILILVIFLPDIPLEFW
jgi:hypothetical protein